MKYTNNLNMVISHLIIDHMASQRKLPVAVYDVVTSVTKLGIVSKLAKHIINFF